MTNRDNQKRLDALAMKYLAALDTNNLDVIDALWEQALEDADLENMLHGLTEEFAAEVEAATSNEIDAAIIKAIEVHLPSAEVIQPSTQPLTIAEVADHLRRHPPAGLTIDDLLLNAVLLSAKEPLPSELGISQVIRWGSQFGPAPDAYWRAFRQAALELRIQRHSEIECQMAARSTKNKPPEGTT